MAGSDVAVISVETDDAIRKFRRLFFGPNGYTLPFEASYTAIGVFTGVAAVLMWVVIAVAGFPFLSYPTFYAVVVAVLITKGIMKLTDSETPLRSLPNMAVSTAKAGRNVTTPTVVKISAANVRVVTDPWEPAVQHTWRNT
jgi:hypothetical protein